MDLAFDNPRHERLVNDFDALSKKYDKKGQTNAQEILATIDALRAAPSLYDVPYFLHPHPLQGDYKGCFAVDVNDAYRVIFRPLETDSPNYRIDNPKSITLVAIVEIYKDYHNRH